jgi:hypothetical protein
MYKKKSNFFFCGFFGNRIIRVIISLLDIQLLHILYAQPWHMYLYKMSLRTKSINNINIINIHISFIFQEDPW